MSLSSTAGLTIQPLFKINIVGPSPAANASASVQANTNIPLDYYMLIKRISWFMSPKAQPSSANYIVQNLAVISENLNLTQVPSVGDPTVLASHIEVDTFNLVTSGAVLKQFTYLAARYNYPEGIATIAQTLLVLATQVALTGAGYSFQASPLIEYELRQATPAIRDFLAKKIQLSR